MRRYWISFIRAAQLQCTLCCKRENLELAAKKDKMPKLLFTQRLVEALEKLLQKKE